MPTVYSQGFSLTACGVAFFLVLVPHIASADAPMMPVIEMQVGADCTVILEGKRYRDTEKLKLASVKIAHRKPTPSLRFRAHRKTKYKAVSGPIALVEESG
jgi:hypothetical protein